MTLMAHVSFVVQPSNEGVNITQLNILIVFSCLLAQGPCCWTNLWNGYAKNGVTSAEATTTETFKTSKQKKSENFLQLNTKKTLRTYFFHAIQQNKISLASSTTTIFLSLSPTKKSVCVFSVCFICSYF